MRILYAATGDIAVDLLEALWKEGLVKAVLTAPDAPGKRSKGLVPPPVKVKAEELGIPVYQPETLRSEARKRVREMDVDTLMSFCYGKIFGPMFLSLFSSTFNVHPSLLPLHRGCAPIYGAIRDMDRITGISVQEIAAGVDEGDIFASMEIPLDGTETTASLEERVRKEAPSLVIPLLRSFDPSLRRPQDGKPSYTGFIGKEDGKLDFSLPASALHAIIRACNPWPKAYGMLSGSPLYITGVWGSAFDEAEEAAEAPGTVVGVVKGRGLKIATGKGYLYASKVLPPARKEMDALSYVNGNRAILGSVLE